MRRKDFNELILRLSKSENDLKIVNDTYEKIFYYIKTKLPSKIADIIEENQFLYLTHGLCEEDIINHKEELKKLLALKKENDAKILQLKQENEKLKKGKAGNIAKKDNESYKDFIDTLKGLSKKLGLQIKKNKTNEDINNENKIK